MKSFLRILQYVKPYSGYAILNIVFNILSIVFSLFSLLLIIPFLRILFSEELPQITAPVLADEITVSGIKDYLILSFNYTLIDIINHYGKTGALLFVCLLVLSMFFFKNVFRYLALFVLARVRNGVIKDIRTDLYKKILNLPLSYFSQQRKGDIISRMTTDVQDIEWSVMSSLEVTFREPITVIVYLSAMLFISPELTLFVIIMLPLSGLIIGRIGKSLKKTSLKGQEKIGLLSAIIDETLTGIRVIKAFNAEKTQTSKFHSANQGHFRLMTKMLNKRDLSSPLSELLGIMVVIIVLWFGGKMVLSKETGLDAEIFIGFIVIFSQLIPPAKAFSTAYYNIQKGIASSERVEDILDAPIVITDAPDAVAIDGFNKAIEYKNVSFRYEKTPVLNNISQKIEKGKTIALVGPSGGGKSTLADLLPRFYDPVEGEILIDGVNIKSYKINALRNLMGIVTQESILFNDTVFNNIAFGIEHVSEEAVINAAKIANAHDFITQMEEGYQTYIGDRGTKLSGGQRQRITIARAILKNPPILILDEATSALDAESEKLVQDALFNLMKNRTSIVIAHRLATIKHADEIIVIENGQITERGSHKKLMASNKTYKKLVELQAF